MDNAVDIDTDVRNAAQLLLSVLKKVYYKHQGPRTFHRLDFISALSSAPSSSS